MSTTIWSLPVALFARNMGPSSLGDNQTEKFVPPAEETALRQTRWQKVIYPNKITRKTIDRLQAVYPSGHPGSIQHPERPVGPRLGVQSLDALQLG